MKPQSQNLDSFLSEEARRRPMPNLKQLYGVINRPGMVSMAGGMPMPQNFPFDDVRAVSLRPPFNHGVAEDILGSSDPIETEVMKFGSKDAGDILLSSSLQYGLGGGDTKLVDFMKEHTCRVHDIGFHDWNLTMTVGNTFAWDAVLRTFTNPGDIILAEEYSFPSALDNAVTAGCGIESVAMDSFGVIPEKLEEQLCSWPAKKPLPKLLYIIPTGQNPTGSCLSAARRKAIWSIAHRYNFLIVEDEPYYYLQMPPFGTKDPVKNPEDLLSNFVPSFLHFDQDGRVIRLDSFSKIMAPGIRLGWITAQKRFVAQITRCIETSSSKPSGFAQSLVYGVLRRWGQEGLLHWLIKLRREYTMRRNVCCKTIREVFPKGLYEMKDPDAGMFFWLKLDARRHPKWNELGRDAAKVEEAMFMEAIDRNVILVPGHWCVSRKEGNGEPWMYYRGTFAASSTEDVVEGVKRLAATIESAENNTYVQIACEDSMDDVLYSSKPE